MCRATMCSPRSSLATPTRAAWWCALLHQVTSRLPTSMHWHVSVASQGGIVLVVCAAVIILPPPSLTSSPSPPPLSPPPPSPPLPSASPPPPPPPAQPASVPLGAIIGGVVGGLCKSVLYGTRRGCAMSPRFEQPCTCRCGCCLGVFCLLAPASVPASACITADRLCRYSFDAQARRTGARLYHRDHHCQRSKHGAARVAAAIQQRGHIHPALARRTGCAAGHVTCCAADHRSEHIAFARH